MSKLTTDQKIAAAVAAALAAAGVQRAADETGTVSGTDSKVASLAIPESAWDTLVKATAGALDSKGRDGTFLGAVLTFARSVPAEWHGKALPEASVTKHADDVKRMLEASYGDVAKLTKDEQDTMKRTCTQKHSRAKSLFTCSTLLAQAYEQGFKGGIVEAGKLCTQLAKSDYNLAAVMAARKAEAEAPRDWEADYVKHMSAILAMKPEGDDVPECLGARGKAKLVMLLDDLGLKVKGAENHRNNPLANS